MSANIIHVSDISTVTSENQLYKFFDFCGTIKNIDFDQEKRTAKIQFEKAGSAKTALMLNGGALQGTHLTVVSDAPDAPDAPPEPVKETEHGTPGEGQHHHHIDQSDKPRAGIAAEYLARGYTLSDQILQRAIQLDEAQGISGRFLSYIHNLDTSLGAKVLGPEQTLSGKAQETFHSATQQAKAVDEQRGFSKTATDYYVKALGSPFGQKVKAFYTTTSKQVLDIHEEARRIHETHKASQPQPQPQGATVTPSTSGVGTSNPPADPNIQPTDTKATV